MAPALVSQLAATTVHKCDLAELALRATAAAMTSPPTLLWWPNAALPWSAPAACATTHSYESTSDGFVCNACNGASTAGSKNTACTCPTSTPYNGGSADDGCSESAGAKSCRRLSCGRVQAPRRVPEDPLPTSHA